MNYIYKVIFNSRIKQNTPPFYYIGSKTKAEYINGKIIEENGKEYFGSSRYPGYHSFIDENTTIEILEEYENISHEDLLSIESRYQHECIAKTNPDYFNLDYACGHNSYAKSNYGTYKHCVTGKCIRLPTNHEAVLSGEYVGATKDKKLSKDHKAAISKGVSGENNGFYGRKHSEETLNTIAEKASKRLANSHPRQKGVIINGVKYRGVRPAARELGINKNTIIKNIRNGVEGWSYEIQGKL